MKPIDDRIIELLIRHPAALTEEMRRMVEDYTKSDPFGHAVAQFYRDFYEELDALNCNGAFGTEDSLPPRLSAPHLS